MLFIHENKQAFMKLLVCIIHLLEMSQLWSGNFPTILLLGLALVFLDWKKKKTNSQFFLVQWTQADFKGTFVALIHVATNCTVAQSFLICVEWPVYLYCIFSFPVCWEQKGDLFSLISFSFLFLERRSMHEQGMGRGRRKGRETES